MSAKEFHEELNAHRSLDHDCVAAQHDVSARFLVDTSVALHDPLGRSDVEHSGIFASETSVE